MNSSITLSPDQENAERAIVNFITDPDKYVMVLKGYAGTGKSTLVHHLLTNMPATLQMINLVTNGSTDWDMVLTATTNKACQALASITKQGVVTIQSLLKLRVQTTYTNGKKESSLVPTAKTEKLENLLIVIDEASFVDYQLLRYINEYTSGCKILYIGDPAQILSVNSNSAPVFEAGYETVALEKVMRQAGGNPITDMATGFREAVNGNGWPQVKVDGHHIQYLPRDKFDQTVIAGFQSSASKHDAMKLLAYTNQTVIGYNKAIRNVIQGVPELQVGDYAVCNSYISARGKKLATDQLVEIVAIRKARHLDTDGWMIEVDTGFEGFMPESLEARKKAYATAKSLKRVSDMQVIEERWLDLRAAFACTINKSQGSTYDTVFIDLDDLKKCHNYNTLARLMYVGVSRARHHVILTGSFVKN